MIHWLIQTIAAQPDLITGHAPAGLLSTAEAAALERFTVLKRRQDWLLGRWTIKRLLQEIIRQESGRSVALDSISVLPGKDGAPSVSFGSTINDLQPSFSVSISHSYGTSLCAAVARPDWPLGADIELIEPRPAGFAADFFTAEEQAQIRNAAPESREALVTAVWSGKEAALKAIHEGLRSDTRVVSCHFAGLTDPGSQRDGRGERLDDEEKGGTDAGAPRWRTFRIGWEQEANQEQRPALAGWWMISGGYVLTLAAGQAATGSDGFAAPSSS